MLYQKIAMFVLVLVGLWTSVESVQARLGETREQTDKRYGTVVHVYEHRSKMGVEKGFSGPTVAYEKNGLRITCIFHNDMVCKISFLAEINLDLLDMKTVEMLLVANAEGEKWSKVFWSETDLSSYDEKVLVRTANWARSDGGNAGFSEFKGQRTMNIFSPWTVARLVALDESETVKRHLAEKRDSIIEKYKILTASGDISDF